MGISFSHQPTLIALASHKGGSGRTTLALNLAAAWSAVGSKTVVMDLDPQQGASLWALHTNQSTPSFNPISMVLAGLTEHDEEGTSPVADILLQARSNDAERVIVDLPSRADFRSRAVLRAASLILVPTSGTALDSDLTAHTLQHIRETAGDFTLPTIMLIPVLESGQIPPLTLRALGLPLTPIVHRQPELSQGLAEPNSKAAAEISALADYTSQHITIQATTPDLVPA